MLLVLNSKIREFEKSVLGILNENKRRYVWAILFTGLVLRFFIALKGHNYDFDSYLIVGDIVAKGLNVFSETHRYNYGPFFSLIQGFFYSISELTNHPQFIYRFLIISLLSFVDILLFFIIYNISNLLYAFLFFLNPISIIISGFHNQFDNIAVLFGLIAMIYMKKSIQNESIVNNLFVVLFLSISLIFKHILFFFPFWLLVNTTISNRKKFLFAFIPPIIFLLSFLPYLPNGFEGILNNVFLYKSENNMPLILGYIHQYLNSESRIFFIFYILIFIFSAIIFRHVNVMYLFNLYLITLVAFSSAIANQYLAIPLVSIILLSGKYKYYYTLFGTIYLFCSPAGLNGIYHMCKILKVMGLLPYLNNIFYFFNYSIVIWVLVLFLISTMKNIPNKMYSRKMELL